MANYKFLNLSNCLHYFDAKSNFFSYVYLFYLFLTFLEIGQNLPSDLTGQTSPVGLKKSNISTYKTYYVLIKCVRIMFLNLSTVRITCCYSIMFRKEVVLCPPFQDPKKVDTQCLFSAYFDTNQDSAVTEDSWCSSWEHLPPELSKHQMISRWRGKLHQNFVHSVPAERCGEEQEHHQRQQKIPLLWLKCNTLESTTSGFGAKHFHFI